MEIIEPELAFYYPNPVWSDGNWVKNLLLFFDGIALLIPQYMIDRPFQSDPAIAEGLREAGLLTILEPETFLDKAATLQLANAMESVIGSGALDGLSADTAFHELSWSRLGAVADMGLAAGIYAELEKRNLAKPSKDGVSIPMHPLVRSLVLVLLSQILRSTGKARGLDLQPATDRPEVHEALKDLLGIPAAPSAGRVISLDLETVGIDLSAVPLDEVLGFRAQHKGEYRKYSQNLRRFVRDLSGMDYADQQRELQDRQDELREHADVLRAGARRAWNLGGAFALTVAGAAWMAHTGDIFGGILEGARTALAAAAGDPPTEAAVYSYLFSAKALS